MERKFGMEELSVMTGITTRSLRSYLSKGFLTGDKSSGAWQFSEEDVEAFLKRPEVIPTLRSKKNAIVYDFLGAKPCGRNEICLIRDYDTAQSEDVVARFCEKIQAHTFSSEMRFSAERIGGCVRIILRGAAEDVLHLLQE